MTREGSILIPAVLAVAILTGGLAVAIWQKSKVELKRQESAASHLEEDIPAAGLLAVLSQLPDFTFTDETGRPFGLQDLKGRAWIADFIYLKCAGPCPAMTVSLKALQDQTEDLPQLAFVTFTVDPDRDSVEDLQNYARNTEADPERWHFLRGDTTELADLMRKFFLLPTDEDPLNHTTRFCLVDQHGNLRGYYDHKRGDDIVRLRKHARLLLTGER